MPKLPIEHGDSGEFARNKINESRNDLLKNVEEMKPHIENGYWWIWDINTNVRARGEMLELRVHEWYIQCKSESSKKWSNVVPIDDLRGKALTFDDLTQEQKKELKWEQWISISNISHSKNGGETTVTFQLSNDTSYDLVLKDWEPSELRKTDTHIQRRSAWGDWKNLLPIDELKGKAFTYEDFTSEQLEALRWGKGDKGEAFKFEDFTPEQLKKLKGEQWDKGDQGRQWDKGDPWESPEFRKTNDYLQIKLPSERTWKNLIPLADITWPAGSGSGDMLKSANLSDLTNKATARTNLEVYSKTEIADELSKKSNTAHNHDSAYYKKAEMDGKLGKKADLINGLVPSSQLPSYVDDVLEYNTRAQFPTTWEKGKIYIAINDDSQWRWTGTGYKKMVSSPWSTDAIPEGSQNLYFTDARARNAVQSDLNGKADLVGGKVPASQLPEVNQIDESNIVHKSWDETIGGKKSFNEGVYFDRSFGLNTLDANGNKTKLYWNSLRAPNNHHHILPDLVNQDGGISSIYIGYNGQQNEIGLSVKWKTNYLLIKDDLNMYINDQNRTGEWQDYTPTLSGSWGGTPAKYWSQRWRYKIIWKMCFWWAKVEFQKWTLSGRPYISLPNKSKWEWESIGAESLVWWTGTTLKNTYWYASINDGKIEILHWFGQAGDWSAIESWDMAISVKFFYEIE